MIEYPVVPNRWDIGTKPTVIIAPGPSLRQEDATFCRGRARVLAVGDSWRMVPWADAMYHADVSWWDYHKGVPQFKGQKWIGIVAQRSKDRKTAEVWGLQCIAGAVRPGLSLDRDLIHSGSNSGFQALNLAVIFGARKILLLGFDMKGSHFFGDHPHPLRRTKNYGLFIKSFESALPDIQRAGITVINCSRETALTCFPRMTIEEALAYDSDEPRGIQQLRLASNLARRSATGPVGAVPGQG